MFSYQVMSNSLQHCPCPPLTLHACPRDFPGKNPGVGCHFFLQGIFQDPGWNLCLLHWQADSLPLSHRAAQISSYLGLRGRGRGLTEDWQGNPWVVRDILYLDYGGSGYKWHIVIKISQIIHLKGVHFIVCKLYFNKVDLKNKTYWHKIITIFFII